MANKSVQWFVEPLNEAANAAFVAEMPGQNLETVKDADGREHRVFRCSSALIQKFRGAAPEASFRMEYRVLNQRGGGQIRRTEVFEPKLPPKRARVKAGLPEEDPDDPF